VPAAPGFSIEKLQELAGGGGSFQSSTLQGKVGQTVDYEIIVKNTGNVPLTFGRLSDTKCDAGTIAGGPGETPLAPGASSTYTCRHVLSAADQSAGTYRNSATDTGTPPLGDGSAIMKTSNTVVVEVAPAAGSTSPAPITPTPGQQATGPASGPRAGATPATPSPGNQAPRSGVLAFRSASVPAVHAPQGCLRSTFSASVKSAGVTSVTFYLDGHRLKTLTARSARKGQFTIVIDATRFSVGVHRLTAKITMAQTASTKTVHASRTATVLRCGAAVLTPKFTG